MYSSTGKPTVAHSEYHDSAPHPFTKKLIPEGHENIMSGQGWFVGKPTSDPMLGVRSSGHMPETPDLPSHFCPEPQPPQFERHGPHSNVQPARVQLGVKAMGRVPEDKRANSWNSAVSRLF